MANEPWFSKLYSLNVKYYWTLLETYLLISVNNSIIMSSNT